MTLIANQTLAASQALSNLASNLDALASTQPELKQWVADQMLSGEWVFGSDGSLTALDEFGGWWSGCSLPRRAARSLLGKLYIKGAVACFLTPSHAAHLEMALERLRPEQAIVAVVPDFRELAMQVHCCDFSAAIRAHRLWFAAGAAWDVALRNLFESQPGLASPNQFIRTPDADPRLVQELISTAQQIFTEVSTSRAAQLSHPAELSVRSAPSKPRLCIVAPSRFRLWNDLAPAMLGSFEQFDAIEVVHFDADDPLCSSPLAFTLAVRGCAAVFSANTGRADLPGLVPENIPWITWITAGRFPNSTVASQMDHLLVLDPKLVEPAIKAGWPAGRVRTATWPTFEPNRSASADAPIGIIADTSPLDTPKDLIEYSSHAILWEHIRHELLADPSSIGSDISGYLQSRMQRARVSTDAFPSTRFVEKLIIPAYQQGIVLELIRCRIPVRAFGQTWDILPEFKAVAAGEIHSRDQFREAVEQCSALVHVWPSRWTHPIDAIAMPIVRPHLGSKNSLIQQARQAIAGNLPANSLSSQSLHANLLNDIVRSTIDASSDTI